ncbi:MAG: serine/threonine-protein kinase [Myxococcaceae bacterium]|nr:serine/threonine-protein kinase [Myxococcaceae bacterium]
MSNDNKPLRGLNPGPDAQRHQETLLKPLTDDSDVTGDEETIRPQRPSAELLAAIAERDPVIGTQVSGYVVKGRLGAGGMGIVYEGEQPVIGKRVAIKVLRPEVADNPDVVQRLVAEARAVNQVGHRGIIDVFGFGQLPDGRQCIVMEYLEGDSLEAVVNAMKAERRLLPLTDSLVILDELLSALAAAHSAGVIHRDLKPSNIFLCKQRDGTQYVKVLDFGIAKLGVLGATPQTNASLMVGTPAYMAPEQARGGMVSAALDLYAVGCIAFELLTGQQPFAANSVVEMIMKHQDEKPVRPSEKVLSLPDVLDDWVLRLLEKKPEHRFASADEARKVLSPVKKELTRSSARMPELGPSVTLSPSMHLEAVKATGLSPSLVTPVVTKPQAAPVNSPAQVAMTQETPSFDADDSLPAGAQSKTGLYVVAALAVLGLVGGGAVLLSGGSTESVEVVAPSTPPAPLAEVKPVVAPPAPPEAVVAPPAPTEPPPPSQPPPVEAKPVEAPPVEARPVDPPKPVEVAKPVDPPKPVEVARPVEARPPPVQPQPRPPSEAAPKKSPNAARLARIKKLEPRLKEAEDTLNLKMLKILKDKLSSEAPLSTDELTTIDIKLNEIEESL